jgi:hypothetical protein
MSTIDLIPMRDDTECIRTAHRLIDGVASVTPFAKSYRQRSETPRSALLLRRL